MFKRKKNETSVDEELEYGQEGQGVYSDYDYDAEDEYYDEYGEPADYVEAATAAWWDDAMEK